MNWHILERALAKEKYIHIALIGGTGLVGSAVLTELTSRDVDVTAIIRTPGKITENQHVTPVVADVYDTAALTDSLRGVDIVVSAFNPGWTNHDYVADFARGSSSIQAAARAADVSRLIVIGGAGSLYAGGTQLVDTPDFPEAFRAAAGAARDYLEVLTHESDLDWVFVSPPIEFGPTGPTERRGMYRTGSNEPVFDATGHSTISAADLALAIVDEAMTPAHHCERFTVGY